MVKRFMGLSKEGQTLFMMLAVSIAVFLILSPLFFIDLGHFPLGWLLGSLIASVCYWSMWKGTQYLLGLSAKKHGVGFTLLFYALRFILLAAGLVLGALCTFRPEWIGNFRGFSFYTVIAGYLLLFVFVPVKTAISSKREKAEKKVEE